MYHIAVCDDEKDFVEQLTGLLDRYAEETGQEIRITKYFDGMELMEKYDPSIDLIFLDIRMRLVDGHKLYYKADEICPSGIGDGSVYPASSEGGDSRAGDYQ